MRRAFLLLAVLVAAPPATATAADRPLAYDTAVTVARDIGERPSASSGERRALDLLARRFRTAGLHVVRQHFRVPGRGVSGNVIGERPGPRRCLVIAMAHVDSGTDGPGASDNASGTGVVAALAADLDRLAPACTVWLVGTGGEERFVAGTPDHLGAVALVARVRRLGLAGRLRLALSVDTVGTGRRYWLRSPVARPRAGVERSLLAAAHARHVTVEWHRDDAQGNSDHREFALAGLPAMVIEMWKGSDPCSEKACDIWRRLSRPGIESVRAIAGDVIRGAR
jgi:hypothetical protein